MPALASIPETAGLAEIGWAALAALFVWWFSTGLVLFLVWLPRHLGKLCFAVATLLLPLAFLGLDQAADAGGAMAAYRAFIAAIAIWGWAELGFLTGLITGPRRLPCPPQARSWNRAGYALQAILHHELALLALGLLVVATCWNAPNQFGTWTYLLLWVMRLSSKLNLFLGVRALNDEFLPAHLRYLASYFTRRRFNALLPFSIALPAVVIVLLVQHAISAAAGSLDAAGSALLASLLALAVLEHLFMLLPVPVTALWGWSLRRPTKAITSPVADPFPSTVDWRQP